jgi:LysM repeat protein
MGIIRVLSFLVLFFASISAQAQDAYVRHTVQKGETVYSIAQRYSVQPGDIAKYNPDVASGLQEGAILIIPQASKIENAQALGTHVVQPKETLYGLSKQYNCTVEELIALNPELKDGLKIGTTIKVPVATKKIDQAPKDDSVVYYTVEPRETVYSICKAAGITEEEFLALNPEIKQNGLQSGQTVKLPKSAPKKVQEEVATDKPKKKPYDLYLVQPGDNLESIAKKFNCATQDLIDLNPELMSGVVVGKYIVVPVSDLEVPKPAVVNTAKPGSLFWQLPTHFETPKVHITLLAPFYLGEVDSTANSNGKNDKNKVGVQFMAGFQVAMDTLAALGYQIELDVFDTKDKEVGIDQLAKNINKQTDIIVGPFYAKSAEQLAALLPSKTIYSPLSKAVNTSGKPNLVDGVNLLDGEFLEMAQWINKRSAKERFVFVNTDTTEARRNVQKVKMHLGALDSNSIQFVWTDKNLKGLGELSNYRVAGKKTNFVVVDQEPAFLTLIIRKLYRARDTNMVLLTTSKVFDIPAIEPRQLSQVNLLAMSSEYIDYSDTTTQQFIQQYRTLTGTEPSKYAYSGYDAGLYFAQLIAAYGRVPEVANWPVVRGVFKGFRFVENQGSGPVNTFALPLSIKDYKIVQRGQ